MVRRFAYVRLVTVLTCLSVSLLATSAYGQSPVTAPAAPDQEVVTAQGPRSINPEKKVVAEDPRPGDLESEVTALKTENAAVREHLRKMEEQQKALLELVDGLRRRLDGFPATDVSRTTSAPGAAPADAPLTTPADASVPATSVSAWFDCGSQAPQGVLVHSHTLPQSWCTPPTLTPEENSLTATVPPLPLPHRLAHVRSNVSPQG